MSIPAEPREPATDQRGDELEDEGSARPGGRRRREVGGPKGLEPTRYGDWERNGICYDF